MPSQNTNIIGDLRGKFDPHYKLASNVEGLEKGLAIQVAQLHKTLSKSFGMQRKTLMRVLALEKQVAELRQEKQTPEQDIGDWADESAEWDRSGGASSTAEEGGTTTTQTSTATATKDPGYASRVMGKDASGEYLSPSARKLAFKRKKISASAFKKGSSVGGAQKVAADTTGASALAIRNPSSAGVKSDDVTPEEEKGGALAKGTESLIGPLKTIDSGVNGIIETLKQSNKADAKEQSDARKRAEKAARAQKEGKLEGVKDKLATAAQTVIKPVTSIFEKIWNFLKIVFLGRVAVKLFEWFTNPENSKKVTAIFRFLKDWWPVLVAGIMAIVGPGMIFTAGLVALLMWGVPKIIDAVKWVGSLFGIGVDKELKNVEADADKFAKGTSKEIGKEGAVSGQDKEEETKAEVGDTETPATDVTPSEVGETQQQATDVQSGADQAQELPTKMAGGGQVPGTGSGDTVPAMLTPGEFVMSKGAVQQYGADTLAGMNAAAGGTNRPTRGGYKSGGIVNNMSNNSVQNVKGGPRIHYNGGGIVNMNRFGGDKSTLPRIPVQYFKGGGEVGGLPELGGGGGGTDSLTEQAKTKTVGTWIGDGIQELFGITPKRMRDTNTGMDDNAAKIVKSSPSQIVINPPPKISPEVITDDPVGDAKTRNVKKLAPDQELPEFSASKMRSGSKIKTLGIAV